VRKPLGPISYANAMATIALFIALGGSAYAATRLPARSVGGKQLKANAVTGAKVKNHSLNGRDIDLAALGTVPMAAVPRARSPWALPANCRREVGRASLRGRAASGRRRRAGSASRSRGWGRTG